jgi:hypothetical protein
MIYIDGAVNAEDLAEGSKAQPQHSEVLSPTPQMSPAPFEARRGSGSNGAGHQQSLRDRDSEFVLCFFSLSLVDF